MPGLLEGLLQGYMTGKEHQRQSLLDQLEQQRYAEGLKLRKQALKMDEEQFKFQQSEAQRKAIEQKAQQEFEDTQKFFGEQGFSVARSTPSLIDQLTGAGGGTDTYGTSESPFGVGAQSVGTEESNYTIAPKPGFRREQEQKGRLVESQIQENLRQAKTPVGGEPSDQKTAIANYLKENPGKTYSQGVEWYKKLTGGQTSQPGFTIDQVLQKRQEFINKFPERPISQFYKEIRLAAPAESDSLAAAEFGIGRDDVGVLMRYGGYRDWVNNWFKANQKYMSEQDQRDAKGIAKRFFKEELQEKFK